MNTVLKIILLAMNLLIIAGALYFFIPYIIHLASIQA